MGIGAIARKAREYFAPKQDRADVAANRPKSPKRPDLFTDANWLQVIESELGFGKEPEKKQPEKTALGSRRRSVSGPERKVKFSPTVSFKSIPRVTKAVSVPFVPAAEPGTAAPTPASTPPLTASPASAAPTASVGDAFAQAVNAADEMTADFAHVAAELPRAAEPAPKPEEVPPDFVDFDALWSAHLSGESPIASGRRNGDAAEASSRAPLPSASSEEIMEALAGHKRDLSSGTIDLAVSDLIQTLKHWETPKERDSSASDSPWVHVRSPRRRAQSDPTATRGDEGRLKKLAKESPELKLPEGVTSGNAADRAVKLAFKPFQDSPTFRSKRLASRRDEITQILGTLIAETLKNEKIPRGQRGAELTLLEKRSVEHWIRFARTAVYDDKYFKYLARAAAPSVAAPSVASPLTPPMTSRAFNPTSPLSPTRFPT